MNITLLNITLLILLVIVLLLIVRLYNKRKAIYELKKFYALIDNKKESKELYKLLSVNSIQDLQENHAIYPWEHVIGSPIIDVTDRKVIVDFTSPPKTWEMSCGVEGPLTICRITNKQTDFYAKIVS